VSPYADITGSADRRWTFRLLDRLVTPNLLTNERDQVVAALRAMSDRRAVPILEQLLLDRSRPAAVREAAGEILRGLHDLIVEWPEPTLRGWWHGSDPILRRHALLSMDAAACPDIVRAVASDTAHPFHLDALGRMEFYFDSPADQRIKIAALVDPNPTVRAAAAGVLLWDEPVTAEEPLIRAARDTVAAVVIEAVNTLKYYPSTRTVRCLHGLLGHPTHEVRTAAQESLDEIKNECLIALGRTEKVAGQIRCWLRPVWDLLAITDDDLEPDPNEPRFRPTKEKPRPIPVAELLPGLFDPDTSPRALGNQLWANGWAGYSVCERSHLRPVLLNHDDPLVRERAAVAMGGWRDVRGVLSLLGDHDFGVRKAAMYWMGQLPRAPELAAVAWEHLHRPDVFGVHASETLRTFVAHADASGAVPRLAALAADRTRTENLRVAAVHHLAGLEAVGEVRQLAELLTETPAVTWALQIAVLGAVADLGLARPEVRHLVAVDNLHVQAAVGRV
jgi:HEAT repeat protein